VRFTAQVAVIFGSDKRDHFDVWEYLPTFESAGPQVALDDAISISKSVFDKDDSLNTLGYSTKPILYGVRALHSDVEFPPRRDDGSNNSALLLRIGTLDRGDFDKLLRFADVLVPYRLLYLPTSD
jgi:hypothetical protein